MKKLQLHPIALCRTAACSYADDLSGILPELKAAIRESSPEFHALIKDVEADCLDTLDAKVRHTLWKYANRIRYRATPYGRFAAVTPVTVGACAPAVDRTSAGTSLAHACGVCPNNDVRLTRSLIPHNWPDWSLKERLLPVDLDAVQSLRSNGSHYRCGTELRYLFNTGIGFEMAAVDDVPELTRFLDYCAEAQPKAEVLARLADWFGYEESEATDALRWLVDEQLLLTDCHPNITGPDYFGRVGYVPQPDDKEYLIPERQVVGGAATAGIGESIAQLPEAATFLAQWLPSARPASMEAFTEAFSHRFEQREVPLMEALDPELGVGYGGLEDADVSGELIAALKGGRTALTEDAKVAYGMARWNASC